MSSSAARTSDWRKRRYLNGGAPLQFSALGSQRRVQALVASGWMFLEIAAATGIHRNELNRIAHGTVREVLKGTADKITALYDKQGPVAPRKSHIARRYDWAPPAAWDNPDNPDERPKVTLRDIQNERRRELYHAKRPEVLAA